MSQAGDGRPAAPPAGSGSERWRRIRLSLGLTPRAVRRARLQLLVFAPLFAGVILAWLYRHQLFGLPDCAPGSTVVAHGTSHACLVPAGTTALQVVVVLALVILGWQLARDFGRAFAPLLFGRMDAATAGTTGFLVRLVALVLALVVALRFADISLTAIAIGASASAVVIGLAAQQTLGNLIAGIVLLSARPFRVGDTVRLQVGQLAGQIEGVVTELGLMYTTFDSEGDLVLVPNSAVLAAAVRPLREPEAISLRLRLREGWTPLQLQQVIEDRVSVPIRRHPRVELEEVDGTEIIVTVTVTPRNPADGAQLASELLAVVTREVAVDGAGPAGGQAAT